MLGPYFSGIEYSKKQVKMLYKLCITVTNIIISFQMDGRTDYNYRKTSPLKTLNNRTIRCHRKNIRYL